MANQRSPGQTVISMSLGAELKSILDTVSARLPGGRSQFIRDAIRSKLLNMGKPVADSATHAPSRIVFKYAHAVDHEAMRLNESSHSPRIEGIPRKKVTYRSPAKKKR